MWVICAHIGPSILVTSAHEDESMGKCHTNLKAGNIFKIYSSSIFRENWPAPLTEALVRESVDAAMGDAVSTAQNTERDKKV